MPRLIKSVVIRRWAQADIDYVSESINREGWGYTRQDVERCWNLEPNGCFIAEFQNKPVGHVFSICYSKIGWTGLLIVNPETRSQGIGSVLMKTAVNYLQEAGAETIRLDAVERAVPLYKRLGFAEEFDSLRFRRQLTHGEKQQRKRGIAFQVNEDDVANIAQFDTHYFGANRLSVLQSIYKDYPRCCFVAKERGCTVGYIMARQIKNGFWIGPWVCENAETAQHLFNELIQAVKGIDAEMRVGLPALNIDGRGLVEKLGFQLMGKSIHMALGSRKNQGDLTHIYGIGGPEKG